MQELNKIIRFLLAIIVFIAVCVGILRFFCFLYPNDYKAEVDRYSRKYGVSAELVYAVIRAESKFDKDAVSSKGAKGLMQIMDTTCEWVSEKIEISDIDLFDPAVNIEIGTYYLSYLLDLYKGNKECAIAAYNAGPANVDEWLSDEKYSKDGKNLDQIPFEETDRYVKKVMENIEKYGFLY